MNYEDILTRMQEKYRELTGFEADRASDIGIRLQVLAGQMAGLFARVEEIGRQTFPQTATGDALERHAACRGLARKAARPAEGMLRFSRQTAPAGDIPIAQGVICATRTEPQVRYETLRAGVLPAGGTEVDIPAKSIDAGSAGNVSAGAVGVMVNTVPGITAVRNPAPFGGGVDEENDEALRERLLGAYREISNGTNAAFYYNLVMQHEKVLSAQIIPRRRGRGTVDVVYSCASAADDSAIQEALQKELARRREINVDVKLYPAARQFVDITAAIEAADGYDQTQLAGGLSGRVMQFVAGLEVGQPLYKASLTAFLMGVDGVRNAVVMTPAEDVLPVAGNIVRARSAAVTGMSG